MRDKGKFDDFSRVIKYKSLESVKDINNFINFDDKANAVSDFFSSTIEHIKWPFGTKKIEPIEQIPCDENDADIPELVQKDVKETLHKKTSKMSLAGMKLDDFVDMGYFPKVLSRLSRPLKNYPIPRV